MFKIGDKLTKENYTQGAIWANKNNAIIKGIGNGQYQIVELPKPSLEELKLAKREEINDARDEAEQGGFEYMGKVFDSDQVSCIRMIGASQALANAPAETTITWTCQENSTIDLTAAEMQGLISALAVWSNSCHEKATALKAQIDAATTNAEVEAIKWG